jgi:hypothetical protein
LPKDFKALPIAVYNLIEYDAQLVSAEVLKRLALADESLSDYLLGERAFHLVSR